MFCPNCGGENRANSKFCLHCGAVLAAIAAPRPAASAMPTPVAPARPAAAQPKARQVSGRLLWLMLALLAVLVLGVGAFLLFGDDILATVRGSGNDMLVAFPNRNGEVELYLLSAGEPVEEGTLLAEDAVQVSDVSYYHLDENSEVQFSGGGYGAFVPGARRVLFWYREAGDDDALINVIRVSDDTPTELFATNALPVMVTSHAGLDTIHIGEQRAGQWRCYSAQRGESARRLTKGDGCGAIGDGAFVYAEERDDDELTVTLYSVESGSEEVLLDSAEGVSSSSLRFSEDGSHFAYTASGDDGVELFVMDLASGEAAAAGAPQYSVLQHTFIPRRDVLYYLVENDDGDVELYLSNIDSPIARGAAMSAVSNRTGEYLLYVVGDEDGENTAYFYNMGNGDVTTLRQGDGLRATLVDDLQSIFLWETDADEFSLYSVPLAGGTVSLVFETDDVDTIAMRYVEDTSWVLLEITDIDGDRSLYAATPDGASGFYIIKEWLSFTLHDMTARENRLLLTAVEDRGDDPVLLLAQLQAGAPLIELDSENEGFLNAVFSANGREVFYTAITGNDADDVQVVRAPATGEEAGKVLYEEARLDTVSWTEMQPFRYVSFAGWPLRTGSILCPGAPTLAPGDDFQAQVDGSQSDCYRFRLAEGKMITLDVRNVTGQSVRFRPVVLDRDGQTVSQTSFTYEPWLTFVAPANGLYFLRMDSESANAMYRLRVAEGNGEPAMTDAREIRMGESHRDAITSASQTRLLRTGDTFYGNWYFLDARSGDSMTIDVSAESLGSELDATLYLFDPFGNALDWDDGSGPDSDDRLMFRPPQTARYYLLVKSLHDSDFGADENYFYELSIAAD